jgi:hypothetical protein
MNHLTGLITVGILCGCVNNVLGWGPLGAMYLLRCAFKPLSKVQELALTGPTGPFHIGEYCELSITSSYSILQVREAPE